MTRISALVIALLIALSPVTLRAQDDDNGDGITQAFLGLIYDKGRGFTAAQQTLNHSFAAHLHSTDQPLSIEQLSALGASYDPASDTPLTAGTLYYHLAYPISLLRELGGGENEIFARIFEIRIRWLAGDIAGARFQAEDLVVQYAALGASDEQMVSVLADVAVLAWRDGDVDAARAFLARAQSCAERRCQKDVVFGWLGTDPKPYDDPYEGYDPDLMRARALADGAVLMPGSEQMADDINAEWSFVTGRWTREMRWAMTTATAPGSESLSETEQRRVRRIADRMLQGYKFFPYLMRHVSVAGEFQSLTDSTGQLSADKLTHSRLSYLGAPTWRSVVLLYGPVIHRLYLASDRPGDVLVARSLKARFMLMENQPKRALELYSGIVTDARRQGFSDAQLHSILMDQWAAAVLAGSAGIAAQAEAATALCRQSSCPQDILVRLFNRVEQFPEATFSGRYLGSRLIKLDPQSHRSQFDHGQEIS